MPSIKMKRKSDEGSTVRKDGLHVCQKSNVISKNSSSCFHICPEALEPDTSLSSEDGDEAIEHRESLDGEDLLFQMRPPSLVDRKIMGKMDILPFNSPDLDTIFSPFLEYVDLCDEANINGEADGQRDIDLTQWRYDNIDDNSRNLCDYRTCNVSDFLISDMVVADLPFDGNSVYDETVVTKPFDDYKWAEQGFLFDVSGGQMIPPCDDTSSKTDFCDSKLSEEIVMDSGYTDFYLAIDQIKSENPESYVKPHELDQAEGLESQFLNKDIPLSEVFWSSVVHKEDRRKQITLVLDLDETLVHSTLEHSENVDFTFQVFFNMKEQTVYVKQRPFLRTFLERVADMFEIIVFTASQSIYAEQLLDRLDPDGKLISRRAYRDSCIFCDGSYTKDLTVLGIDLAKVAIIDNSPQVFRLQMDNGIPIKSWFDDPSDSALISLLPFLETLAAADDVRPIIAKKFCNKE